MISHTVIHCIPITYGLVQDNDKNKKKQTRINVNENGKEIELASRVSREKIIISEWKRDEILFWSDRIRTLSTRINDQIQPYNFSAATLLLCYMRILLFLFSRFVDVGRVRSLVVHAKIHIQTRSHESNSGIFSSL